MEGVWVKVPSLTASTSHSRNSVGERQGAQHHHFISRCHNIIARWKVGGVCVCVFVCVCVCVYVSRGHP